MRHSLLNVFRKQPWYVYLTAFLIGFGHLFKNFVLRFSISEIIRSIYVVGRTSWLSDPLEAILYYHATSPFLSVFNHLMASLNEPRGALAYLLFFILVHLASYGLLESYFRRTYGMKGGLALSVLMLNPMVFIYLNQPFYTYWCFLLVSVLIYFFLAPHYSRQLKFVILCVALAMISFIRPSWHLFFVFPLALSYGLITKQTLRNYWALILFILPLSLFVKNKILFDTFSPGTLMGLNIAREHLPPGQTAMPTGVGEVPFVYDSTFDRYITDSEVDFDQYKNIEILQEDKLNHIKLLALSKVYMEEAKEHFSLAYSLKTMFFGYFRYLDSPANNPFMYCCGHSFKASNFYLYDPLDLPDVQWGERTLYLSWYVFIYTGVFLFVLLGFRSFSLEYKILALLILVMSGLYFSFDPYESPRMRMELEPLFWVFAFSLFSKLSQFPNRLKAN